jgi:hypothetical protein
VYVAVGLRVGLFFALLAGFYLVYQLREVVLALLVADLFFGHSQRSGQLPAPARPALPPEVPEVSREVRAIPATAREDLLWCVCFRVTHG